MSLEKWQIKEHSSMRDRESDCDSCFPSVHEDLLSLSQEDSHFHDSVKCADVTLLLPYSLLPYTAILIVFQCYAGISILFQKVPFFTRAGILQI